MFGTSLCSSDTNLHTVHNTTHRLLRTSATTLSAQQCSVAYNLYSWWWAYRCPKHVDLFTIINKIVASSWYLSSFGIVASSWYLLSFCIVASSWYLSSFCIVASSWYLSSFYKIVPVFFFQYSPLWQIIYFSRNNLLELLLTLYNCCSPCIIPSNGCVIYRQWIGIYVTAGPIAARSKA
jgi:hypothetical protein